MRLTKGNITIGVHTGFGPNWMGIRCLTKIRCSMLFQRPARHPVGRAVVPMKWFSAGFRDKRGSCAPHRGRASGSKKTEEAEKAEKPDS